MNINYNDINSKISEEDKYNPFSFDSIWPVITGAISAAISGSPAFGAVAAWSSYQVGEVFKQFAKINDEWKEWDAKILPQLTRAKQALKELQDMYDEKIKQGFTNPADIAYDWYTKSDKDTRKAYSEMYGLQKNITNYMNKKFDKAMTKSLFLPGFPFSLFATYPYSEMEELSELSTNINLWLPNIMQAVKRLGKENESQRWWEEHENERLEAARDWDAYFNPYIEGAPDVKEIWPLEGCRDPFISVLPKNISEEELRDPFLPLKGYTKKEKGFDLSDDFSSYIDDIMSLYNIPGLSSGILEGSAGQSVGTGFSLLPSSSGSAGSGFTMGEGINIPLQYEIEVTGLEQFEKIREEVGEAVEESRSTVNSFSSEMMKQFLQLSEEKRAAFSVDMSMLPMNIMGIGGAPFQFSLPVEESKYFSETLSDIAGIAGQLGGAFMNVNENIGKAIGSAGGLAGGISNILDSLKKNPLEGVDTRKMTPEQIEAAREQGEKQKGLAIMSGIQGGFAGLQGLFGGEADSDTSQLMGGLGGAGAGVAGLLTGNPLEGITSLIGSISSLIDGLTESTQEGYVKQLQKQGFNDTYSQDLLDKMSAVSDKMGDKSFGMKAYIEDFFKETNIDTAEEFGRMSDLLNESVGEYVAQGHTMDEAYEKFGDELEQLTEAQEKYGFETVASLDNMLEQQRTQTKEGRIEGLKGALGGYDKIISGLEKQMKLTPDFKLSEASISGIAGSLTNTYQELLNQGMGAGEAVEAVKPLLTHYSEMAQQQGWDLSKVPGFSQLSTYFESLDKASGALDMIQGSADVVKALSGSGLMDQATLQGQESLGMDVMRQLEASGLNETQRLQQMGGWLQAMQQASEKWGLTLSPEVQALISKAEEKGVMPEEEKPVGEVISEGIVQGFEKACGVIDNYFGKLTEYAEGGIVPGAPGGKKLVWAHAGEAIGYPAELESPVKMLEPIMEPAISGLNAMADVFKQMDDKFASGWNPLGGSNSALSQGAQPFPFEEVKKRIEEENARNAAALKDQLPGEGQKLDISQTIENKMSLVVNSRDFVQTLKQDIYDQIKEDSKRGLLTIHDKAIKSY